MRRLAPHVRVLLLALAVALLAAAAQRPLGPFSSGLMEGPDAHTGWIGAYEGEHYVLVNQTDADGFMRITVRPGPLEVGRRTVGLRVRLGADGHGELTSAGLIYARIGESYWLYAVDPGGTLALWRHQDGAWHRSMAVGRDGIDPLRGVDLAIVEHGSRIELLADGQSIGSITNSAAGQGAIGIGARGTGRFVFEAFHLQVPEPTRPILPLAATPPAEDALGRLTPLVLTGVEAGGVWRGGWIDDGGYVLENHIRPDNFRSITLDPAAGEEGRRRIGTVVTVDGPPAGSYAGGGLVFGLDRASGDLWALVVDGEGGLGLYRREDGGFRQETVRMPDGPRQGAPVELLVAEEDSRFFLHVDGRLVAEIDEPRAGRGGAGVIAFGPGRFRFDGFEYEVAAAGPTTTPAAADDGLTAEQVLTLHRLGFGVHEIREEVVARGGRVAVTAEERARLGEAGMLDGLADLLVDVGG